MLLFISSAKTKKIYHRKSQFFQDHIATNILIQIGPNSITGNINILTIYLYMKNTWNLVSTFGKKFYMPNESTYNFWIMLD